MRDDKVDGRAGLAAVVVVEVGAAGHARRERALDAGVALDKAPHVVAEHAVPLGPDVPVGERSDLVHAQVPGLGDEVNLGQHGVLGDVADERRRRQRRALAVCLFVFVVFLLLFFCFVV